MQNQKLSNNCKPKQIIRHLQSDDQIKQAEDEAEANISIENEVIPNQLSEQTFEQNQNNLTTLHRTTEKYNNTAQNQMPLQQTSKIKDQHPSPENECTQPNINKLSIEQNVSPRAQIYTNQAQHLQSDLHNQNISLQQTILPISGDNNNINNEIMNNDNMNNIKQIECGEISLFNRKQLKENGKVINSQQTTGAINQTSQIQNKLQCVTNSQSGDTYHRGLISQSHGDNTLIRKNLTLWQVIRLCAALIFLIQQTLQWSNFAIILRYNSEVAWTQFVLNVISPTIGLFYILYQFKKYDYFFALFPRKRVGVFFVILSFFNLDFVFAQLYQALYVSSSDYIKIFNENNLRKKRLNLFFQNFISVILTSYVLFDHERMNINKEKKDFRIWETSCIDTSAFFIAYIFFQVFDLAFHMAFFSTDFFDDIIALFFNLFDLCCTCFRDDDEDDDDDDEEEAYQVKYDNHTIDQQQILFRQIPFSLCTFLRFIKDNLLFSLSFYHNFIDLSIRALLFGISHRQHFFSDQSLSFLYSIVIHTFRFNQLSSYFFLIYSKLQDKLIFFYGKSAKQFWQKEKAKN